MKKGVKGQVSVFLIIAIVIVVLVGIYVYYNTDILKINLDANKVDPEVRPIYNFVRDCIEDVASEGVHFVGQRGGYVDPPVPSYEGEIAYYLYGNKNYMPSKEKIEEGISTYVDFIMPFCIDGFEDFFEFEFEQGEIKTKTIINDNKVVLETNFPLSITKGNSTYAIENFDVEIPVRLGIIYNAIGEFMIEQMIKTDAVCVTCLNDISEKYVVKFHVLDTNEELSLLFVVRDEKSKLFDEDYVFYFVNKLREREDE